MGQCWQLRAQTGDKQGISKIDFTAMNPQFRIRWGMGRQVGVGVAVDRLLGQLRLTS